MLSDGDKTQLDGVDMAKLRNRATRFLWPGLALLVVLVAAVAWGLAQEEDDLGTRARAALADAGIEAEVTVEGRDVAVAADTQADAERAETIVADLRGVRTVSAVAAVVGLAAPTTSLAEPAPTTAPSTSPPPPTTAPPVTTPPTTVAPTTTVPETTTTTAPQPAGATLTARLAQGTLTVQGTVPSEEVAAGVAAVADLIYAPFVDNQLQVDAGAAPAAWLPAAPGAIAVLPLVGEAELRLEGDSATLVAKAATPEKAARLQGAVEARLAGTVPLEADIEVTGQGLPSFSASAPGDGTVTLSGVMPDQAAVDRIVGAASQAFGAENVTADVVVGDDVSAEFTVFRIPLVFIQFAPIPQWEFNIDGDVITGNLRGGATFDFGSAELTPELQALLGTAAGIITRNPTLALTVEGHTDAIGSNAFNQGLSEARAQAAVDYLVTLGVPAERLVAVGYGETRPIGDNATEEGRARNRRVEFAFGPAAPQGDQ